MITEEPDEEKQEVVDEMNAFMSIVLPDINESRMPDIEAGARVSGRVPVPGDLWDFQ